MTEELIGLGVEVVRSTRRELVGLRGKIVDETLNTFVVEASGREKRVPKELCVFRFAGGVEIDGRDLAYRPEERIKKYWTKFRRFE